MPDSELPLSGFGILVTRPVHQSEGLQRMLSRMGARVFQHALLRIGPPRDPNAAQAALASIEDNDITIFVSANAVRAAVTLLPELASHLKQTRAACLGVATAKALQGIGVGVQIVPESGSTSEALLATDEMSAAAINGRRISIIKGEGGRSLLADTLSARGAQVHLVSAYQREPVGDDLTRVLDENAGAIDIAIITSGESLARLHELAGLTRIRELALVLPSERVLKQAVDLGCCGPFTVPQQVNDDELARAAARLGTAIRAADETQHG